jgi:Reverse transcriptase (RNA-dependent DNA polymerase).
VNIQVQFTEAVGIARAWRQADALPTTLFNIVLEKVIRNIENNPNGTIFNKKTQYTAYADEVLILGRSVRANE